MLVGQSRLSDYLLVSAAKEGNAVCIWPKGLPPLGHIRKRQGMVLVMETCESLMCMLHESLACVWSVITTKEWHGRPVDTNASVSSLASLHAVMGPQAVYSASLYIQLSYTIRAAQPKTL